MSSDGERKIEVEEEMPALESSPDVDRKAESLEPHIDEKSKKVYMTNLGERVMSYGDYAVHLGEGLASTIAALKECKEGKRLEELKMDIFVMMRTFFDNLQKLLTSFFHTYSFEDVVVERTNQFITIEPNYTCVQKARALRRAFTDRLECFLEHLTSSVLPYLRTHQDMENLLETCQNVSKWNDIIYSDAFRCVHALAEGLLPAPFQIADERTRMERILKHITNKVFPTLPPSGTLPSDKKVGTRALPQTRIENVSRIEALAAVAAIRGNKKEPAEHKSSESQAPPGPEEKSQEQHPVTKPTKRKKNPSKVIVVAGKRRMLGQ